MDIYILNTNRDNKDNIFLAKPCESRMPRIYISMGGTLVFKFLVEGIIF